MSKIPKTLLAIYIGWVFLHLVFLSIGWNGADHSYFFPFAGEQTYSGNELKDAYDISEFLVYVGGPAVIFVIYRLINNEPTK
jgi:hypothetical protein